MSNLTMPAALSNCQSPLCFRDRWSVAMVPSRRRANQNCVNLNKSLPQKELDESATTQFAVFVGAFLAI